MGNWSNEDDKEDNTMIVYPNPNTNQVLYLKNPDNLTFYSIEITDVTGRTVWKGNLSENVNSVAIPSHIYLKGMYIVQIVTDGAPVTQRIIFQ